MLAIFEIPIVSIFSKEHIVISEVQSMLLFIIISLIVSPIITMCSHTFVGLKKSPYNFYFIILNLILVIGLIILFSEWLGMSVSGIFVGLILGNIIESTLMIYVLND